MFTKEWVDTLRGQLAVFVEKATGSQETPVLTKIFENYVVDNGETESVDELKAQSEKLQAQLSSMKEKKDSATGKLLESQTKWTSFAKDILAISKELFKAIHTLQSHNTVPKEFLEMSAARIQKYEMFLNESELTFRRGEEASAEDAPEDAANQSQGQSQSQMRVQPNVALAALDYNKIKMCLKSCKDDSKVCALLQALRLRLLKTSKGKARKQIIQWFITYDLLGCANPKDDLFEKLLKHSNKKYVSCSHNTIT